MFDRVIEEAELCVRMAQRAERMALIAWGTAQIAVKKR